MEEAAVPGTLRERWQAFWQTIIEMTRLVYQAAPRFLIVRWILLLVTGVLSIASAWVTKLLFDALGIIIKGEPLDFGRDVLPLLILQGGLLIAGQTLNGFSRVVGEELGRRVRLHTSLMIYRRTSALPGLRYFESPEFHDTLRMASRELGSAPEAVVGDMAQFLSAFTRLIGFIGVLLTLSPALVLVLALATIPSSIAQLRFNAQQFRMSWRQSPRERKAWYLGDLISNTRYAKEIRLFNLGEYFYKQYEILQTMLNLEQRQQALRELRVTTLLNVFQAFISTLTKLFVIGQAFAGLITLGTVVFYLEAVTSVQDSLWSCISSVLDLMKRSLFLSHYRTLIALEPDLIQQTPKASIAPLQRGIELRNVSFRYEPDMPYVLKDVSFTIERGECLALVGVNGAGKTTLVKLLARFYDPTDGQILWDGVDIRQFDPAELRHKLGAVFQDFAHYDLTARENIGLGELSYIDDIERIQEVAEAVDVDAFIQTLPKGYETILSRWLVDKDKNEKGGELSGGQWQKIAIARAYLRDMDVLMLDEPTAALDAEAEEAIYMHFKQMMAGRTSLLISHRFSTVRMADKIAVLDNGEITEHGTHHELLALNGTYARLYTLQAQKYA